MVTPHRSYFTAPFWALAVMGGLLGAALAAEPLAAKVDADRVTQANYNQAFHFNTDFLRQFVYDAAVNPNWIGKSDTFWYSYRTSRGTRYWRVDCRQAVKTPLFDSIKLATLLSEATQKPLDAAQLPLTRITIDDEGAKIKFVVETTQYEYDLTGEKLTKLGPAPPPGPGAFGGRGGRGGRGNFQQFQQQQQNQQQQNQNQQQNQLQQNQQQQNDQQQRGRGGRGFGFGGGRGAQDYRAFSPDRKAYVFVRNNNLYL